MGPVNKEWIRLHGEGWAMGRIDVCDGSMYGSEIHVPAMKNRDWARFGNWLNDYKSSKTETLESLSKTFEIKTGININWLRGNNCDY